MKAWQSRPLDAIFPIVYLDCIHVKVREGTVRGKAVYLAIGITMEGKKEIPGLWLPQNESAKFWLQVVTELRNRGVQDIFIACVGGLKGFPEAIEVVFPKATAQLCIVHMIRHSLNSLGTQITSNDFGRKERLRWIRGAKMVLNLFPHFVRRLYGLHSIK